MRVPSLARTQRNKPHSFEAEHYAEELSSRTLAVSPRFLIYGADRNVHFWREWFAARPEFNTWPNRLLGPFGDVDVALFENPKFTSLASAPLPVVAAR
jgi:hypothetical protein